MIEGGVDGNRDGCGVGLENTYVGVEEGGGLGIGVGLPAMYVGAKEGFIVGFAVGRTEGRGVGLP